jgi:protein SCO1/2
VIPIRAFAVAAMTAAVVQITACDRILSSSSSPFKGVDITGSDVGKELKLSDPDGRVRTLADFRGKVVVVVFGYTQCPDVCPTTLAEVANAMKQLGEAAAGVQVLFVTVDPKRDTAQLLREYLNAFDPAFLGLRGDAEATRKVTSDFRVYASEREGKTADSYTVDHSAQTFIIDRNGKVRLLIAPGMGPAAMASDLKVLLNS